MAQRMDRAARRRLLKDDEAWLNKPLDLAAPGRAMQAITRHLAGMLLDTHLKRRASRAAAYASQVFDKAMDKNASGQVACGKGCHYCCKTFVSATIPEVLRLAHAVKNNEVKVKAIVEAGNRSKTIPPERRELDRVICPILHDKICSEYLHRPISCRSVLSKSLDSCLRIFEQNINEPFPYTDNTVDVRTYMVIIFQTALVLSGLPHQHYELNHALTVALTQDNAEERWLAGEKMFENVDMDPSDLKPSALTMRVQQLARLVAPTL